MECDWLLFQIKFVRFINNFKYLFHHVSCRWTFIWLLPAVLHAKTCPGVLNTTIMFRTRFSRVRDWKGPRLGPARTPGTSGGALFTSVPTRWYNRTSAWDRVMALAHGSSCDLWSLGHSGFHSPLWWHKWWLFQPAHEWLSLRFLCGLPCRKLAWKDYVSSMVMASGSSIVSHGKIMLPQR